MGPCLSKGESHRRHSDEGSDFTQLEDKGSISSFEPLPAAEDSAAELFARPSRRGATAAAAAVAAEPPAAVNKERSPVDPRTPAAVLAAAVAAGDGVTVGALLRQHPLCCSQSQLNGLLAEASLAGRARVVRPLLELGGANVREALARGWCPVDAMDAGQVEVVELMAQHGGLGKMAHWDVKDLADKAVEAGAAQLFASVLRSPGFTPYETDFGGWLATACYYGHADILRVLLPRVQQLGEPHRSNALVASLNAAAGGGNQEAVEVVLQAMGSPL